MHENRFSRRYFFYGTLLAGAVPAGGFGSTPSLPALGYKSFNEKLNIAAIGVGTRGPQILPGAAATENIVALCDVDEHAPRAPSRRTPRRRSTKTTARCSTTEGKNIDAVMIATPDHLHTPMALLVHAARQARLLRKAADADRVGSATARATRRRSTRSPPRWATRDSITKAPRPPARSSGPAISARSAKLHAWTGGIYGGQPNLPATGPEAQPVPATLDWDLWLGPAASRGRSIR